MHNNQQGGGYSLPYQSRLDSLNPRKPQSFNPQGSALPLQRPNQMTTETALPVPPKQEEIEDPMVAVSQGDFFKSNQSYMQDPQYATGFNDLVTTAGALRDQVSKGFMPDTIAQERLQNKILELRSGMEAMMQPEQQAQSTKRPSGALSDQMSDEEIAAEMAAMVPATENVEQDVVEQEEGPTDAQLEQAMGEGMAAEGVEQEPEQPPMIDPRYQVSDPQIEAVAAQNLNRSQGIGDFSGNMPAPQMPTQNQLVNAEFNAGAETMADQANIQKEWWKNDSFTYSMTRMVLGLLDGEDVSSAFAGANESYMMLSGMEKRQEFIPDLKRQGYNEAQIEEYVRTGDSKALRATKAVQAPKWSSAGGGMMMNTAGESRAIPGWQDKSQQITPYQSAQLDLAQRRQEWAETKPASTGARKVVQSDFEEVDGKTYKVSQYDDGTMAREQVKAGEGRVSEGERVRQKIQEAPDDQYVGAKGPNSFSGDERQKIGYMQDSYRGSADYVKDVFNGKIKPADLNTLSSNVISAIVMDPKQWASSAVVNSLTKEEQSSLNRLKKIIDPVARARSGAAIGVQEMETYLSYLKNIHRKDGVGAQSRVGMISTISSLAPGTRKDLDILQNEVLPRARDAQPGKNGNWNIAYIDDRGDRKVFEFKPGRFFVSSK